MSRIRCGVPLTPYSPGHEIQTCDFPVPPTPCGTLGTASPCEEDHTLEIITNHYGAALKTDNQWAIPACGQTAQVVVKGLRVAHIGSWIWSDDYGNFLIEGFNPGTDTLTINNPCITGTKSPGTVVPACSLFIVSPPPCSIGPAISFLSADFIVPAVGDCVTVMVTSTEGILAGYDIVIGGTVQQFHVSAVINMQSMEICNTGFGGVTGSTVQWQNPGGDFAHPIIVSNSSSVFDKSKTQALPLVLDAATPTLSLKLSDAPSQLVTFVNPSNSKAAQIFYTIQAYANGNISTANTGILSYNLSLKQAVNGGALTLVTDEETSKYTANNGMFAESKESAWDAVISIAPLQTFTLDAEVLLTFSGGGGAAFNIDNFKLSVVGLVVIS